MGRCHLCRPVKLSDRNRQVLLMTTIYGRAQALFADLGNFKSQSAVSGFQLPYTAANLSIGRKSVIDKDKWSRESQMNGRGAQGLRRKTW